MRTLKVKEDIQPDYLIERSQDLFVWADVPNPDNTVQAGQIYFYRVQATLNGTRWQGYFLPTMTDLFWQPPHTPVGVVLHGSADNIIWTQDDGTCQADYEVANGGGTDYHRFYPLAPQVECRLSLPDNYGMAQDESPPALPTGITIGFLSPVTNTGAGVATPPAPAGFDASLNPLGSKTAFGVHATLCNLPDGCRFAAQYAANVIQC